MIRADFDGIVAQVMFRYDLDMEDIVVDYAPILETEGILAYDGLRREFAKRMIFEGLDIMAKQGILKLSDFQEIESKIDESIGGKYYEV